ncbi:hypothetical protein MLD38_012452 [Melastoma candidum]|uniref:Uncharacterized protein n=1 Tax=Melastoma candidum TaxID=119954 RepID=A0ACB9R6C7_9MYRT|nr:hypothetical protein MLD38_012452 [Melastoma candidum]
MSGMFLQDSYALCRVFKKNATPSKVEEQVGRCSFMSTENFGGAGSEYETMSPDIPIASSSSPCVDEDGRDDSWMQFITDDDDAWYPSNSTSFGGDVPQIPTN